MKGDRQKNKNIPISFWTWLINAISNWAITQWLTYLWKKYIKKEDEK